MANYALGKSFSLLEIQLAAQCLSSLLVTISLDDSLAEMQIMQPERKDFWQAAGEHLRRDQPLHTFLKIHWPPMFATPVEIGEHAGQLEKVFQSIEVTAELQISIQSTLNKLVYPVGMILAGTGVCFFFMLYVIPVLSIANPNPEHASAMTKLSLLMHSFIVNHTALVAGLGIGIAVTLFSFARNPSTPARLLAILDHIPVLSDSVRSLYYGLWARYIALMIECGIPLQDALSVSYPLLLPYMVPGLEAVRANAQMGYGKAVDISRLPNDDPRHGIPIFVRNAFRLTDQTGAGDKHFSNAAAPLVKLGMVRINRFINVSGNAATAIAGLFVTAPVGMYFMQMIDLISNLNH